MPVEPTKRIPLVPIVRREENTNLSQRKKPKDQKREDRKGPGKIDIKV
jgi:hypothetical protein